MNETLFQQVTNAVTRAAGYDKHVAYLMSVIAAWSYAERQTLESVLRRPSIGGAEDQGRLEITQFGVRNPALPVDVQCFLISFTPLHDGAPLAVLSFRGTEPTEILDFLTDALVEGHQWPQGGAVHRGFFLSLDVLWPELRAALSKLTGSLLVTGHSLGGAIAVLAGRMLMDEQKSGRAALEHAPQIALRGVHTFGQPMVGDQVFVDGCEGLPLYRHVHANDLVPHLPPRLSAADEGRAHDPSGCPAHGETDGPWSLVQRSVSYVHCGTPLVARQPVGPHGAATWFPLLEPGGPEHAFACEPCDPDAILPAFLTLLTSRAPFMKRSVAVWLHAYRVMGRIAPVLEKLTAPPRLGSLTSLFEEVTTQFARTLGGLSASFSGTTSATDASDGRSSQAKQRMQHLSVDHHIPTHYVDVSRASIGQTESYGKRG